jgi:hypothetical protein
MNARDEQARPTAGRRREEEGVGLDDDGGKE